MEGDVLHFRTANSSNGGSNGASQPDSGIGLDNVRKRLALLYPGKHELNITNEESVYSVELKISTGNNTI
jgi:LytS/YehU family sensor histidine kinase